LRKHVKAVPPSDVKRLGQLIADLDNDDFAVRERAQRELERMGEDAAPVLRKALAGKPALEVRRRIESILKMARRLSLETLQVVRAVEVLENIGTPEARELLKSLADGVPEAVLTQEAKASLERLAEKCRQR
jgi:HEAT repeat protein